MPKKDGANSDTDAKPLCYHVLSCVYAKENVTNQEMKVKMKKKSRATGGEKCHAFLGYNWANAGVEENVSSHGGR